MQLNRSDFQACEITQRDVSDFVNDVIKTHLITIPLCDGMSCVVLLCIYSVKKHSIKVHLYYKFIDTTSLQLKQKQVLKSK